MNVPETAGLSDVPVHHRCGSFCSEGLLGASKSRKHTPLVKSRSDGVGRAELRVNGGAASSVLSGVNQPVGGWRDTLDPRCLMFWWCRQVFAPSLKQSIVTNPSVVVGTARWKMGTCVTSLFWYFVYSQHTAERSCSYLGTLGVCWTSLSKQGMFLYFLDSQFAIIILSTWNCLY